MCDNCQDLESKLNDMHDLILRLFEEKVDEYERMLDEITEKQIKHYEKKIKKRKEEKINKQLIDHLFRGNKYNENLQDD